MVDTHDDLDGRLAALNPLPGGVTHTQASSITLDEIKLRARSGARDPVASPRRRLSALIPHTRRGVAALSVVGLLAAGTAAAATTVIISAYTGQSVPTSQSQAFGGGQWLRVGGAGYCAAAATLTAGVTYPSGYETAWHDWALLGTAASGTTLQQLCSSTAPEQATNDGKTTAVLVSTGEIDAMYASSAFCAWTDNWVRAELNGDTATASTDAAEIASALQWPASKLGDPDPRNNIPTGDGLTTQTRLGWIPLVQQAVASGDITLVRQAFNYYADPATNPVGGSCWMYRPPADSVNGTYAPPPTLTPPAGDGF